MHRPRPLLTALAATATATTLLALPALAAEGKPSLSPSPAPSVSAGVDPDAGAGPGVVTSKAAPLAAATTAPQPTHVRPTPTVRPEPETLRLKCAGRLNDAGRAAVLCAWSPTNHPRAAGYVLERRTADSDAVAQVATRDLHRTEYLDPEVRLDVTYGYRVRVVDVQGQSIGASEWVRVGVASPTPTVEALDMKCAGRILGTDAGRSKAATCAWRRATNRAARGYQLWRIVDGGGRELAWSGGLDSLEATTRVPLDAERVAFVVLAVDADGAVVGRSRLQTVTFPTDGVGPVDPPKLDMSADAKVEADVTTRATAAG